ncbi:MAG: hypothetical protein NZ937_02900 [Armatimonadetes bacterium]|nr:hypothetical protein [Armatimonadota bacterium]
MLFEIFPFIVYPAEEFNDKILVTIGLGMEVDLLLLEIASVI